VFGLCFAQGVETLEFAFFLLLDGAQADGEHIAHFFLYQFFA
jgi:hypothetical protein